MRESIIRTLFRDLEMYLKIEATCVTRSIQFATDGNTVLARSQNCPTVSPSRSYIRGTYDVLGDLQRATGTSRRGQSVIQQIKPKLTACSAFLPYEISTVTTDDECFNRIPCT